MEGLPADEYPVAKEDARDMPERRSLSMAGVGEEVFEEEDRDADDGGNEDAAKVGESGDFGTGWRCIGCFWPTAT